MKPSLLLLLPVLLPVLLRRGALVLCLVVPSVAGSAPHDHGTARLDIAVEAGKLTLQLQSPLDNLLGFERAPRTDAERRRADAAVASLKAAATLFKIDPAAGCAPSAISLNSTALKLGPPDPNEPPGHADIDASFEFNCADVSKAGYVDVALFDAFIRLQRIEVQVATAKGQFKRSLKRPAARVSLIR